MPPTPDESAAPETSGPARISIVSGALALHSSSAQLADRLKDATRAELERHGVEARIRTRHLTRYVYDIADLITDGEVPDELAALHSELREAHGIITVSPTFQGSMSGLYKSFWDTVAPEDLEGLPVVLGATGGSPRHAMMLAYSMQPLFSFFRADVVPTGIFATGADLAAEETLADRVGQAAREFAERVLARRAREAAGSGAEDRGDRP